MIEKSPLETLNAIHELINSLHTRMTLLEKNVALVHEKINGNITIGIPKPQITEGKSIRELDGPASLGMPRIEVNQTNSISTPTQSSNSEMAKVHGKVLGPDRKPLLNVSVLIKNQKGDTTKQLKTGRAGEWITNLPVGKYAITYTREKMTPIYRFVEVKQDQHDIEVV